MKRIRETIEVAEPLWRALEQMSHDLGVDRDALVAQALFLLAKQNGYVAPTPVLLGATSAVAQAIPTEAPTTPRPPVAEPASRPVEAAAAVSPPVKEPVAPSIAVGAQEPAKAGAPADDDVAFVRNRMKDVLASVDATVLPREVPVPSAEAESEEASDEEEPSDEDESDGNDVASDDDEESEEDEEESDDGSDEESEEDEATGDIAAALAEASEDTGESDTGDAGDEASEDAEDSESSEEERPADEEDDGIAAAVGAEAAEDSDEEEASDDAGSEDDAAGEDDSAEQDDSDASDEPAEPEPAHASAEEEEPEETTDSGKREGSTNITQAPQPLELFVRLAPGGPAVMVNVPRFTLGRGPNCSLTVKSGRVSREHAVIVRVGDDFFIEDLGSSNGTWINHQRIKRQKIADGDTFNLGTEAVYFSMGPRED